MNQLSAPLRRLRRAILGRRRVLAAAFAGLAVAAALRTVSPPPPETETVVTAVRDLPSGRVLDAADLELREVPVGGRPGGAVTDPADVTGRTLAAPLRAGEPVTDVRLVAGALLDGYPGTVAAPVRIGDADTVRLLRVGDRIDLLAADPQAPMLTAEAVALARDVPVVALPRGDEELLAGGHDGGALIVVAVPERTAQRLAGAAVSAFLSVVVKQ